jgi:hypothetical protein
MRKFRDAVQGGRPLTILWFDSNKDMSESARAFFKNAKSMGFSIEEKYDFAEALEALKDRNFDVVIANFGSAQLRYPYRILETMQAFKRHMPLVIFSATFNDKFDREARCYGAVARETQDRPLFNAVIRAIDLGPQREISHETRSACIDGEVKPYDTEDWRRWLAETRAGRASPMPALNWD